MKYIIEIEDEPFMQNNDPVMPTGTNDLYRAKGFNSLVFDKNELDKLTPYTEPDRKAIENAQEEVWMFVRYMALKMGFDQKAACFGSGSPIVVVRDLSFREAKAKYNQWKKDCDKIKVGDEVEPIIDCGSYNEPWVVTAIDSGGGLWGIGNNVSSHYMKPEHVRKTGRHFPQVEELLKAMKGEEK